MKKKTKTQIFAVLVILIFLGSSIAFALMYVFPQSQEVKYYYERPLTEDEEAVFLNSNIVIIEEFFSPTCPHCQAMEPVIAEIMKEFEGNIVLEKIDINKYGVMARELGVTGVPTFIIKGRRIERIVGETSKQEILRTVCELFPEPIDKCSIYY